MADSNSINIGGVKFNKADIKSAGTVEREGKTLNSVFLKDGTQVVFPNQSEKNESSVEQHNKTFSFLLSYFELRGNLNERQKYLQKTK